MGQYYGINNFSELPGIYEYDPRTGAQVTRRFYGPPGPMNSLAGDLAVGGTRFRREFRPDGGYSLINAFYGAEATQAPTEALADLWDLDGNDVEKSLWEHPKVIALFDDFLQDGIPTDQYVAVRKDIADLVSGTKVFSEIPWWTNASENMKDFVKTLVGGHDTYYVSQWVLRHRLVIARNWNNPATLQLLYGNVDKVFPTTSAMANSEGIPLAGGIALFTPAMWLPDGMWIKKAPKRDQIAADKWQYVVEYWQGEYIDSFSYDQAG